MEAVLKIVRAADRVVNLVLSVFLVLVLLYGGYALWDTYQIYNQASLSHEILHFKPTTEDAANPTLEELRAINPDICGWVTVEDTNIDHPIVRGKSNSEYLNKDIYKNFSLCGSIFLDYRNAVDFGDFYNLLYGHHMDGGAMFGDVKKFEERSYFDQHSAGWLFTPGKTYRLEIFAYLAADAFDSYIFNPTQAQGASCQEYLNYIVQHAVHYRELGVTTEDRLLALSTCSSASTNGRSIVVARMIESQAGLDSGGESIHE